MRLRRQRAISTRRRPRQWRLPVTGGIFVLIIGAACLAPLASNPLAPMRQIEEPAMAPLMPVEASAAAASAAAVAPPSVLAIVATPTPTRVPTPVVVPTLTASGQSVLASVKSDRTAQWVKNHTETDLRSGPNDTATVFTRLPQWSTLKQIDARPDWLLVEYGGDGDTRQPGPGWVKASDIGRIDPPTVWLSTARSGSLWSTSDGTARRVVDMPASTLMEVIGPDFVQGTRAHVRLPGDGRTVPPAQGWVDGDVLRRTATPGASDLPWAYPADLHADVRINVPYRSQLDGSDFAGANCGPTVLGMALESFGLDLAPPDLRGQVLNSEDLDPGDTDAGSFIWALARVAQSHGLQTHGLYDPDGAELHHWSQDEIRDSVRRGQPVIVQVVYRGLPGREDSGYYGDHYIIVTGLLGDQFLYNDPIGGQVAHEGPGYDRMISPSALDRAMHASDTGYAYTAFGLSKN
jgi:Peptidase_C39 like family